MDKVFLCLIYPTGSTKYTSQVSKCILKMRIMLLSLLIAFAHHTLNLHFRKQIPLDYLSSMVSTPSKTLFLFVLSITD